MSALIQAAMGYYTVMANNSAYSMMMGNNARLGLLGYASNLGAMAGNGMDNVSFKALADMDTKLELQAITDSFNYKYSKAMLEKLKKMQEEDDNHLNYMA